MTRCTDIERLVSSYIDGDIDEHRARAVRGHARECPACARLLENEGALVELLGSLDAPEPPDRVWQGIATRLAAKERGDARRSALWLWWKNAREYAAPAALVAAGAVVAVLWSGAGREVQMPPVAASAPPAGAVSAALVVESARPAPPTFAAVRQQQIADAERAYLAAIADLQAELDQAAPGEAHSRRLASLKEQLGQKRAAAAGVDDPASRDEIHRLYHEQVAAMQDAALAGAWP